MLVGERMSKPVITLPPDMPIVDALNLMKREHIRRAPVVRDGKMVGIVSDKDLLNASPSPVSSLSIWEMNYLLSKITVEQVMTKNVMSVSEDLPIEEAARIMADNKIGGMPVMRDGNVVGIITETDLFKIFLEFMGARDSGVRVTATIEEKPGQLAKVTEAIAENKGNFISFGVFSGADPSTRTLTFKVNGISPEDAEKVIAPVVKKIVDIRSTH
jgi:acetoin utilization protein AcuB